MFKKPNDRVGLLSSLLFFYFETQQLDRLWFHRAPCELSLNVSSGGVKEVLSKNSFVAKKAYKTCFTGRRWLNSGASRKGVVA